MWIYWLFTEFAPKYKCVLKSLALFCPFISAHYYIQFFSSCYFNTYNDSPRVDIPCERRKFMYKRIGGLTFFQSFLCTAQTQTRGTAPVPSTDVIRFRAKGYSPHQSKRVGKVIPWHIPVRGLGVLGLKALTLTRSWHLPLRGW